MTGAVNLGPSRSGERETTRSEAERKQHKQKFLEKEQGFILEVVLCLDVQALLSGDSHPLAAVLHQLWIKALPLQIAQGISIQIIK